MFEKLCFINVSYHATQLVIFQFT